MLTERDKLQLRYLGRSLQPLWGGHLQRGEPISDPDMQRWLELGLIEAVGTRGYLLTVKGRALTVRQG